MLTQNRMMNGLLVAFTCAIVGFTLLLNNSHKPVSKIQGSVTLDAQDTANADNLTALLNLLSDSNRQQQQRLEQLLAQQNALLDANAKLQRRLEVLEGNQASGDNGESTKAVSVSPLQEEMAQTLDERQLSQWMEHSMAMDYQDLDASDRATQQALDSLNQVGELALNDLRCGEGFCRAAFAALDPGSSPDVGNIMGYPPFVNEGFTMAQSDGTVVLYFTQEGISFDELRGRASPITEYN